MKEKERELMERYIYEVVRRVPKPNRDDIRMELQELIEEMQEKEQVSMEQVLMKLGSPSQFAKKYRDEKQYLISPAYFDNYVWVLKIVMLCVAASSFLSAIVEGIMQKGLPHELLADMFFNLFVSSLAAFGAVTAVFAFLERQQIKIELKKENEWHVNHLSDSAGSGKTGWTPRQLSPVPGKRALISRGESVAGIVFMVLFCALLIFAPHLLGAYVFEEHQFVKTIPVFNLESWNLILPVLLVGLLIGFADQMIRLVTGRYCYAVMISNIVSGVLQMGLAIVVLKLLPFWNPAFVTDTAAAFGWKAGSKGDLLSYWGTGFFSDVILALICFATILEIGTTIYKTLRYGENEISF